MTEISTAVKRRTPNVLHPKDWERRARVIAALSSRCMTISDLAEDLEVTSGYLSAIIWGRRRLASAEHAIATALGRTWDELFSPSNAEGRAA